MNGAIHIIRISGDATFKVINSISKQKVTRCGYQMQKIDLVDEHNRVVDHVIINKYVSPHSFTGEDTIEINCHGGYYLANKIIDLLINRGCSLAKPGEFSQRAFMNNKLNIIEAEAINNLINATNDTAIALANQGFDHELFKKLQSFRKDLFMLVGQMEVNIDYPEYDDVPEITRYKFKQILGKLIIQMRQIVINSKAVAPYRDGINVAIIGRPNVGKSSLLNTIVKRSRAIVTNIPGTTTDVISERININGLTINLMDTAGLRNTHTIIESLGVKKTRSVINEQADLLLFVIDGNKGLTNEDKKILHEIKNKKHLVVINKADLNNKIRIKGIKTSAKLNQISDLITAITKSLVKIKSHDTLILQSNHAIATLENVVNKLLKINVSLKENQMLDLYVEDLHDALKGIDILLGTSTEFVEEMFKHFCVGK
jgi:tRNA modification GTPase